MSYHYLRASDAADEHRLPSVEVFYAAEGELFVLNDDDQEPNEAGWYYAFGFPGCLWDGEPMGPYPTEADALRAARGDDGIEEG